MHKPTRFTVGDFRRAIRQGAFAWPGGYPRYFVCDDGEALSFAAARANRRNVLEAIADGTYGDRIWRVVGVEINWVDGALTCVHSGKRIPSAYAEERDMSQATRTDTP